MSEHHCPICEFKVECEKNHGEYREDGDDYRAVEGTHFCAYSWKNFYCGCGKISPIK